MHLLINGQRAKTIHVGFYELGTQKVIQATVKNDAQAAEEATIWTSETYEGHIGIRLTGAGSYDYPGGSSREGFDLGALAPNEEVIIDIQLNLSANPGRTGENYIPIRLGKA